MAKRQAQAAQVADADVRRVKAANALPTRQFHAEYIEAAAGAVASFKDFSVASYSASDIPKDVFEDCFGLIKSTSLDKYKASTDGWSAKDKRREMKAKDMRFVVLYTKPPPSSAPHDDDDDDGTATTAHGDDSKQESREIVGFVQFMLTRETNVEDDFLVIYCYEIHISPKKQEQGFGGALLGLFESVGKAAGIPKAMLTCFTSNEPGLRFYARNGYEWYDEEVVPQPKKLRGGGGNGGDEKVKPPGFHILIKNLK